MKTVLLTVLVIITGISAMAQVVLKADGKGDAYAHISHVLGGQAYEVPDCIHPVKHITEEFDKELREYVFVFHIHVKPDNDRCKRFDRQRVEIKTYGPSPANLKGWRGETVQYQWKFKIDSNFKAQPTFTHLHQIKAGDGDDGMPIITLTARYGKPDQLEVIQNGSSKQTSQGIVKRVNLDDFKGAWVEATETVKYDTHGTYSIEIKRIRDGKILLAYSNADIDLWRDGATFCRPKWGIYRSLKSPSYIRDENVKFADFSIAVLK